MAESDIALGDRSPLQVPYRRGGRTRTIPEQIADWVGIAIINGEYKAGDRMREQELASLYRVSRGPVREAIRALEARGLVEFFPRRGSYVLDLSLDSIADLFNIRASLMGLAARCFARCRDENASRLLATRIDETEALAHSEAADPIVFARHIGRAGAVIARYCGNSSLSRMLSHQGEHSIWGLIWRQRTLDFVTQQRQLEAVADWRALSGAVEQRRDLEAEMLQREILFKSRDHAIAILQELRGGAIDAVRLIRDRDDRGCVDPRSSGAAS